MRGVVSAGMLAALEDIGIGPEVFDEIFGSSAGALNAAFYIAGQASGSIPLYIETAANKAFKDPRRLLCGQPIINLDYLVDNVQEYWPAFNPEPVLSSKRLRVMATSVDQAEVRAFPPPTTWDELAAYLKASASIPIIAGPPKLVEGERFLDAAVGEAIPWETPLAEGYSTVLVLTTRRLGAEATNTIQRRLLNLLWTGRYGLAFKEFTLQRRATRGERAKLLADYTLRPADHPPYVFAIAPDTHGDGVSQLESDSTAIREAGALGFNAVREALGLPRVAEGHQFKSNPG